MTLNTLQAVCKTLHLAHVIDGYSSISFENKEQFLRDVLRLKIESRQTKKITRQMKKARFREVKWLQNYEWGEQIHLPATVSQ